MFHPSRGGVRGGKDQFKWDDVKADKHRENYLGHSVMAPVGRWQKGKDLHWYNKDKKGGGYDEEARTAEIRRIKEEEEDLMNEMLGLKPKKARPKDLQPLEKRDADELFRRGKSGDVLTQEYADGERIQGVGFGPSSVPGNVVEKAKLAAAAIAGETPQEIALGKGELPAVSSEAVVMEPRQETSSGAGGQAAERHDEGSQDDDKLRRVSKKRRREEKKALKKEKRALKEARRVARKTRRRASGSEREESAEAARQSESESDPERQQAVYRKAGGHREVSDSEAGTRGKQNQNGEGPWANWGADKELADKQGHRSSRDERGRDYARRHSRESRDAVGHERSRRDGSRDMRRGREAKSGMIEGENARPVQPGMGSRSGNHSGRRSSPEARHGR